MTFSIVARAEQGAWFGVAIASSSPAVASRCSHAKSRVVRDMSWPVVDLRVDWADQPIDSLTAAWMVFQPQLEDYVRRAIDPPSAPSYHVAGDPVSGAGGEPFYVRLTNSSRVTSPQHGFDTSLLRRAARNIFLTWYPS